ncbi:ribosome maturation factor RimP [Merdibacter massiliensis]|uniref:ribosome maturation factor RimP n=1 Tax=Merdibacter massiliensis TaxID=1871030 RepID=UPI00096AA2BD|nr:ribosome maturation factor RimP [Merdibacter massiliensis]
MDQIEKIKMMIQPVLQQHKCSLYDLKWVQDGKMRILQVSVMYPDGSMDIDTCAAVSEGISSLLDESDIISHEYFLEVCSPGAERELRSFEEIKEAIGEYVFVKLKDPKAGMDSVKGTLLEANEESVTISYMAKAVRKKIMIDSQNIALIRLSVKI